MTAGNYSLVDRERVWHEVDAPLPDGASVAWKPNPDKDGIENPQRRALRSSADELFYGGAKGGAKTDTLLAKPLYQVHKARYAGAFVRQTYRELQRVIDRAHQIYRAMPAEFRPTWTGNPPRFTWPSGAFVQFGYTEHSLDWAQGGNWAQVLYDEMGNDPDEKHIDTLVSEIRCPDPSVVRQLAGSGNPGFAGHPWVKRRYIVPCGRKGERIHYGRVVLPNGHIVARSREFIPSRVTDNPTYANDYVYLAALMQLPERMRRCLMDGDWDAATGVAFDELEDGEEWRHIVKPFPIPSHWPFAAGFDWGFVHNCVYIHARVSEDGRIYIVDCIKRRLMRDWDLAGAFEELVPIGARTNVQAGSDVNSEIKAREDQKSTRDTFSQRGIHLVAGNTSRVFGYTNLLAYLGWRGSEFVMERQPMLQFFDTPGCRWLYQQLQNLVMDPDDPRDVLKVDCNVETGEGGDDGYDALRVMCAQRPLVAKSGFENIVFDAFSAEALRAMAERARKGQPLPLQKKRSNGFFG